jgi:aspartate/methionine/tyrosine aminotransferase
MQEPIFQVAQRLEGIEEYYFSQKLREIDQLNQAGKNIINLGIGSPDLAPHPQVIQTLNEAASAPQNHAYQNYKGSPILREAIAKWYKRWYEVDLDFQTEILPLIGSKEGIMHLCMTYLQAGDEVLVPNPGYPTYRSAVKLTGANCLEYTLSAESNWQPDFAELAERDLSKVKMMWVNYPQMPTGQLPDYQLFKKIIEFGQKHQILICHDNPYSFILNDQPMSILQVEGAKEVAVELNSLSKSHNMAGWRVGMLVGAKARIEEVLRFKSNMDSGMFLPLQLAAAQALGLGTDWHQSLNEIYLKRRELVFELLEKLDCEFSRSQAGMFVWARIPDNFINGYELSDYILYQKNVFITPGSIFGSAGDKYVRISLCAKEEKFKEAIERLNS